MSRSLFARRFSIAVGVGPIGYLTAWRIDTAETLLRTTDLTLTQIAERVGYADAFGLSTAFKRHRGLSPTAYRATAPRRSA